MSASSPRTYRCSIIFESVGVFPRIEPPYNDDVKRPRVVLVGAGFGGLCVAKALRRTNVDVIVLDKRNHHLFQPLLYQVATAGLSATDIAAPIRNILRH